MQGFEMALIWLVEDNVAFRKATQFVLDRHPELYALKSFESCENALLELKQGARPDVILLDVELPGMDGIQGIPKFRQLAPEVSVLILTVFEDDEKIFRAICAGASGYLLKSEPLSNIALAVEHAIAGGAPMNPQIAKRVLAMFSQMAPEKKEYGLTERELEVLNLMGQGLAQKEIAHRMSISAHTVNTFVRHIYRKLHVNCQTAAVSLALRHGLIGKTPPA
jgi:DNA-binding NarL/FixJ family response regulator